MDFVGFCVPVLNSEYMCKDFTYCIRILSPSFCNLSDDYLIPAAGLIFLEIKHCTEIVFVIGDWRTSLTTYTTPYMEGLKIIQENGTKRFRYNVGCTLTCSSGCSRVLLLVLV